MTHQRVMLTTAASIQVKVPMVGSSEEDARTVELKLRQVQKNKGNMKVTPPADPAYPYKSQAMQHALWEPASPSLLMPRTSSSESAASPVDMGYEVPSGVQVSKTALIKDDPSTCADTVS